MLKQVNLRADEQLLARIDQRAERVGMSRNEWIRSALTWALEQPLTERHVQVKV